MSDDVLSRLAATIKARRAEAAEKSYTRQLLDAGPERCAKKLGEEAIETVIAGVGQSDDALRAEAADLLKEGAAAFQRQLVIGDLAAEYPNEIRLWLEEMKELEAQDVAHNLSSW